MKIDRLIGIITILQKKGKVTAPYLAEKFGSRVQVLGSEDFKALYVKELEKMLALHK